MRKYVLIAIATVSMLGACRQGEKAPAGNETADLNAPAAPEAPAAPAAPAAPVTPDQAHAVFHERH